MIDPRDNRSYRRRIILRQRARRIRRSQGRHSKRDELILIILVIGVIFAIVGGALYFSKM